MIGNVAEDKACDAIYQSTDSHILAMLGSNMVEEVISGNPANSSVSEIGDVARKTDIEELSHTTIFKNSDDIALGEKALSNVEVNKLDDVAEVVESGSTTVIYWSGDIANYQYNMIENPGPLAEMPNQPAKNFYGGRYNMEVLQEDRIMYRAGNAQNPYGRWFTSEPPASVTNVRIDAAVKTHWIDPKTGAYEASSYIDNVYAIKVPKGTTIYTGSVGPQGGVYVGGYNVMQTYIDAPWTFEVVGKTPLQASVYKGYKRDKIEMRGDRAEISDFPLYLNTVAGGLDRRDQTIGGFSFVVKIYALPVVEIIGQLLYLLGRYGFNAQFGDCL